MSQIGKFLNLHPHMQSWAVYNVNGPYTKDYKIGDVLPAQFGGLSYMILDEKGGDVYVIQTESFGKCAIWAPNDPDSNISFERTYLNGDTNGSGGGTLPPDGTGTYLNLHGHMQSWAVYNVSGPYTTGYQIGFLAPAQFGGLSYRILEEKGGDVYIIQTELFGRCAIWAPRDPDSSITSSPLYDNGDTSGGGSNPPGGGNGGIEIPGGLKVFLDPGHGGYDPGALGNGLQEKDIVLAISKRLGVILNSYGISVKYSRETDTFIDLDPRAQQANNWGANLFVSIHANSATASASGTECYTKPAADSKTKQLSANVAKSISSKLGIPNRGHKEEVWRVLMSSNMPAILVETAFITNSSDANFLKNRQDDFANSIASEILKHLGIDDSTKNIVDELNSNGFSDLLGVKLTQLVQEKTIAQAGPIRVKISNTRGGSNSGEIVANFKDGNFVSGTFKNDLLQLSTTLSKNGINISKQLFKLNNKSFSISVADNPKTTTISLTKTLNINDSTFSQSLSIEFDKDGLKEAYEHVTVLIDRLVEQVKPILLPILLIGAAVLFIKLGFLTTLVTLGAAFLSRLGAAIYMFFNYIAGI